MVVMGPDGGAIETLIPPLASLRKRTVEPGAAVADEGWKAQSRET